jgi:hypothetical protein
MCGKNHGQIREFNTPEDTAIRHEEKGNEEKEMYRWN